MGVWVHTSLRCLARVVGAVVDHRVFADRNLSSNFIPDEGMT